MFNLPKIHTILLDMDGVLVDDMDMFSHLDPSVKDMKEHIDILKIFGQKQNYIFPLITEAIEKNCFLTAKATNFTHMVNTILLPYWKSLGIKVEILSSIMKENSNRESLEYQKLQWLKNNGLGHLKANLTAGSNTKKYYAGEGVLLIDDYDRTIGEFISKDGYAIQYTNLNEVMHKLRLIGLCPTNNI